MCVIKITIVFSYFECNYYPHINFVSSVLCVLCVISKNI